jgi:hypothetical protein
MSENMYEKDYILRMIEMLGDFLRAIFGMISRSQYSEATKKLNEAYLSILRNDASFFRKIPADELTTKLIGEHHYTNGHLEILAELLYAEATLNDSMDRLSDSLEYYRKSLLLFEFIDKAYSTYSIERLEKMAQIRSKISRTDLQEQ